MQRFLACALTLQCLLAVAAVAQTDLSAAFSTPQSKPQPLPFCTGETRWCLKEYNIPLTKEALLSALHSDNHHIWPLAAEELAFEGVKDAIPELAALLEAKSGPGDRISLADALAQLGDQRGVEVLQGYCDDPVAPIGDRLGAAERLLRYRPKSCPKTLIEGLQDKTWRVLALGIVPDFKELSPSESAVVKAIVLKSLQDQDFMVRLQAAETVGALGDTSVIPALQAAIPKESDSVARIAMEYSLERLQHGQQ
jgi:HEAT repeat protein